jgi:hypothetical protein
MPAKPSLSHQASQNGIQKTKPASSLAGICCQSGQADQHNNGTGSQSIQRRPANSFLTIVAFIASVPR